MRYLVLFCILCSACSDYKITSDAGSPEGWEDSWGDEPTDGAAQIQVMPDPFDFGVLATDCTEGSFPFYIRNVGDEDLEVLALSLADGNAGLVLDIPEAPFTLGPNDWAEGEAGWAPEADGAPGGTFYVESTDADAPLIERVVQGEACGDMDTDGICDDDDSDRDGDGQVNGIDEYPDHIVTDDVLIDFDDLSPGTRVTTQYSALGITIEGEGAPGDGGDSNVVHLGIDHTSATLHTPDNLLPTWVNDGFNTSGDPGLSGWLDEPAQVVTLRLYTCGISYAEELGGEQDSATLTTLDADGVVLGSSTVAVDTNIGDESGVVAVMGGEIRGFELLTGDFDAVDDLRILRLEAPECGEPLP